MLYVVLYPDIFHSSSPYIYYIKVSKGPPHFIIFSWYFLYALLYVYNTYSDGSALYVLWYPYDMVMGQLYNDVKYLLRHTLLRGTLTYFDVICVWGGCNGKWKDVKLNNEMYK